jgi:hypothetical protein
MARPKNLPKWASDKSRPYGDNDGAIEQLEKNGYVAGDLPRHDDINRIGWDLEKWIAFLDESNTTSSDEVASITDTYTRRATGTDGNYPPTAPNVTTTNDKLDMKISVMENNISDQFTEMTAEEYTALTPLQQNSNARINRKVSSAIKTINLPIPEYCPDVKIFTDIGSDTTGASSYSKISLVNSKITMGEYNATGSVNWGNAIMQEVPNSILTFINGSTSTTGNKIIFPQAIGSLRVGFADNTASLSSLPTIHIFVLFQEDSTLAVIADDDFYGRNAVASYKAFTKSDKTVYIRRITTTKVINTKASGEGDNYRFLQQYQNGDVVTYNAELRPRIPITSSTPLLVKGGVGGATIDISQIVPSGVLNSFNVFATVTSGTTPVFISIFGTGDLGDTFYFSGSSVSTHALTVFGSIKSKSKAFSIDALVGASILINIMPTGHIDKRID